MVTIQRIKTRRGIKMQTQEEIQNTGCLIAVIGIPIFLALVGIGLISDTNRIRSDKDPNKCSICSDYIEMHRIQDITECANRRASIILKSKQDKDKQDKRDRIEKELINRP